MKIKYLFTGVLISMLAFMSCEDPDDLAKGQAAKMLQD